MKFSEPRKFTLGSGEEPTVSFSRYLSTGLYEHLRGLAQGLGKLTFTDNFKRNAVLVQTWNPTFVVTGGTWAPVVDYAEFWEMGPLCFVNMRAVGVNGVATTINVRMSLPRTGKQGRAPALSAYGYTGTFGASQVASGRVMAESTVEAMITATFAALGTNGIGVTGFYEME